MSASSNDTDEYYDDDYDITGGDNYVELIYVKSSFISNDDDYDDDESNYNMYGGYREDILLQKLTKIEACFLTCSRCEGILSDPCNNINDSHGDEKVCWHCMHPDEGWFELPKTREIIESLGIQCPLINRGCSWTGTYSTIREHLEQCDFFLIACPLRCGHVLYRGLVEAHRQNECEMRLIICEFCTSHVVYKRINMHNEVCPDYPLKCENKCDAIVVRKKMRHHIGNDCPYTIIECQFAKYGCKEKNILRCEMPQHMNDFMIQHMDISLLALNKLSDENTELKKSIMSTECKLEVLELKMDHGLLWELQDFSQLKLKKCRDSPIFTAHKYQFIAKALLGNENLSIELKIAGDNTLDNWPITIRCLVTLLNRIDKTKSLEYDSDVIVFNAENKQDKNVVTLIPNDVIINSTLNDDQHCYENNDSDVLKNDTIVLLLEVRFVCNICRKPFRESDIENVGDEDRDDDDEINDDDDDDDDMSFDKMSSEKFDDSRNVTDTEFSDEYVEVRSKKDQKFTRVCDRKGSLSDTRSAAPLINNENRSKNTRNTISSSKNNNNNNNNNGKVVLDTFRRNEEDENDYKPTDKYSYTEKKHLSALNDYENYSFYDDNDFESLDLNDSELEEIVDKKVGQDFNNYYKYYSNRTIQKRAPRVSKVRVKN